MRKRLGESGQSTIEFAVLIVIAIGFVFFYVQTAAIFAFGNFTHYATFMAARAYLSGGPTINDQEQRASATIVRLLKKSASETGLDRWPGLGRGEGGDNVLRGVTIGSGPGRNENSTSSAYNWQEGVRYKFRSRALMVSIGRSLTDNSMSLTSESWLGRHPSYQECIEFMEELGPIDNGC